MGIHQQVDLKFHSLLNRTIQYALNKDGLLVFEDNAIPESIIQDRALTIDSNFSNIYLNETPITTTSKYIIDYRSYRNHTTTTHLNNHESVANQKNVFQISFNQKSRKVSEKNHQFINFQNINHLMFTKLLEEHDIQIF